MSAGLEVATAPRPNRDLTVLAPMMITAVEQSIHECQQFGLDAFVFEGHRSQQLQALYYQRGRTVQPPQRPVTNASTNLYSWHGYGLAVDVISRELLWGQPVRWFEEVAIVFKGHGLKWGGDWRSRDLPHFQWGRCKASPSSYARELFAEGGMQRVWEVVRAV